MWMTLVCGGMVSCLVWAASRRLSYSHDAEQTGCKDVYCINCDLTMGNGRVSKRNEASYYYSRLVLIIWRMGSAFDGKTIFSFCPCKLCNTYATKLFCEIRL